MIIVTGGAGFIGSNLVNYLSANTDQKIVSVDYLNGPNKNYFSSANISMVDPTHLESFLRKFKKEVKLIVHLGAISSTTCNDPNLIIKNNISLSIRLKEWCDKNLKRFIYASSAATYGDGNNGFLDSSRVEYLSKLMPLNLYGWSKQIVDLKFFSNKNNKKQLVGLKFFNVYGPNEFHKDEMRSVVLKIYEKVQSKKSIKLFKSHNKNYKNGEQLRDFIYVKDVIKVINWFINNPKKSGLFNVGSGLPRSFKDVTNAVFRNFNYPKKITYIDTPKNIRNQYQYYTKAEVSKLRKVGFKDKFFSLEDGINDYVNNYLKL
jgi:ADP-L-glycero-D-manno-heptose 6-epimerase